MKLFERMIFFEFLHFCLLIKSFSTFILLLENAHHHFNLSYYELFKILKALFIKNI